MKKWICSAGCVLLSILCAAAGIAADDGLVAWWRFEQGNAKVALDNVSGIKDQIKGNFKFTRGSTGNALEFDGLTTSVVRTSAQAPKLGRAFTIESWIALGAYPWNWCPIVSQEKDEESGYYFGVDSQGHAGMRLAIDGSWRAVTLSFGLRSNQLKSVKTSLRPAG